MKGLSLTGILMLLISGTLFAQKHQNPSPERQKIRKEIRSEVHNYMEQEVLPVLKPQREKLDQYLSATEKEAIVDIRTQLKALKTEMRSFHKERGTQKGAAEFSEAERKEMYQRKKEMRQIMTQAWEIADAHESEIMQLMDEIAPQAESWKQDIRQIVEANRPEGIQKPPHTNQGKSPRARHGHGRRVGGHPLMRLKEPVHFLLWDPANPFPKERLREKDDLQVYPNPSFGINRLSFSIENPGQVQILLINDQAKVLQTLSSEYLEAGDYVRQFELKGLEPGLYFYQIQSPDGIQTIKLILE